MFCWGSKRVKVLKCRAPGRMLGAGGPVGDRWGKGRAPGGKNGPKWQENAPSFSGCIFTIWRQELGIRSVQTRWTACGGSGHPLGPRVCPFNVQKWPLSAWTWEVAARVPNEHTPQSMPQTQRLPRSILIRLNLCSFFPSFCPKSTNSQTQAARRSQYNKTR